MVIFEEIGGDATKISLMKRSVSQVCADAFEHDPSMQSWHLDDAGESVKTRHAKVHLQCGSGQSISSIQFASFGTPSGTCGGFLEGTCHAQNSLTVLEKVSLHPLFPIVP